MVETTLCYLGVYFLPSFFNIIEHMLIYSVDEPKLCSLIANK